MSTEETRELSPREKEIIQMAAEGKRRKAMANTLNISIHTVDTHLRHVHLKTGTHSLSELIVWSLNNLEHISTSFKSK